MAAANTSYELPPLPEYTLRPLPPLFSWISDEALAAALPVIAYWVVSLIYHVIDVYDWFAKYRLHTPAEVLKRNHVTRYEVFRDVIIQQVIQTLAALALSWWDELAHVGKADYDIAWYAQKLRLAQRGVPVILSGVGINSAALATKVAASQPALAAVLRGGHHAESVAPAFASWELTFASVLYWYAIPALQFTAAVVIIDSWEYMLHRAMHMNKWLYGTSEFPCRVSFLTFQQSPSTPATTVCTFLMHTVRFTTIHLKASCSTHLALVWPTSSLA